MLAKVWECSFGSTPAEFGSRYGLEESVRRLADNTDVWTLSAAERVVGAVTAERVRLHRRHRYFFYNHFQPDFIGAFEQVDGRVRLVGRFALRLGPRFLIAWWLVFSLLFVNAAHRDPGLATSALQPWLVALLPLLGVGVIGSAIWAGRADVAWMSAIIRRRLQE